MASNNGFAFPFGPKAIERPPPTPTTYIGEEHSYSTIDKLWVGGLVGFFGGGLAYFIYKKKIRGSSQQFRLISNGKQPIRNVEGAEFSHIDDLPPEIRTRIWEALSYEDLLNLRLTSKFIKEDIDTYVGLNGRITASDAEKYDFYQRIALQSCKITELHDPIDHDFFLNPDVLQTLEIREHTPIPLENVRSILAVCINLRHLKLRLTLNENTREISRVVLEHLPSMKLLTFLHVRTRSHYVPETKNYLGGSNNAGVSSSSSSSPPLYAFTSPKQIKSLHLEMPDLPEDEVRRWKCVLDKQIRIESLIANLGNVNWRFYEQILRQNGRSIEKLVLEGLRGWDANRNAEDPLDWSVFSDFVRLKTADFSCNRGGDHDLLESINFDMFPCLTIEEFFVSRITLPPQAVERVYTEMVNLQRGALDHIGNAGIERANEMAWIIQQAEGHENDGWWSDERVWDLVAHGIFALTTAVILAVIVKSKTTAGGGGALVFGETISYLVGALGAVEPTEEEPNANNNTRR